MGLRKRKVEKKGQEAGSAQHNNTRTGEAMQ
jgi:hypothetical protein